MLVCFQSIKTDRRDSEETTLIEDELETSERQKNLLVRRALECGLQLLARLSHYRVYLTAEERSKHRAPHVENMDDIFDAMNPNQTSPGGNSNTNKPKTASVKGTTPSPHLQWSWLPQFMKSNKHSKTDKATRRQSDVSEASASLDVNAVDLELHMALSCGDIINIVLGDSDPIKPSKPQSPGSPPQLNPGTENNSKGATVTVIDKFFMEYYGRLEYAIGGDVVDSLDEALSTAKAGEMSLTAKAYEVVHRQSINLTFEQRRQYYIINTGIDKHQIRKVTGAARYGGGSHSRKSSTASTNNLDYLRTLPGLRIEGAKVSVEPLIPRIRNTSHMNIPVDTNRNYFKYINRSALYRMQHSVDGSLPAQFREATMMFVSLGKADVTTKEGLDAIQKAVLIVIQVLVKCEGVLQQFAIDDKGKLPKEQKE